MPPSNAIIAWSMLDEIQIFLIRNLRLFFSNSAPYNAMLPPGAIDTDLVYAPSIDGKTPNPTSKLWISDEEPFDDQKVPGIFLTGFNGPAIPLGLGDRIGRSRGVFTEVIENVSVNTNVEYHGFGGARRININFGIRANTTSQRARLSNLVFVAMQNRNLIRGQIEKQSVYPEAPYCSSNGGGEEFSPGGGTLLYKEDLTTSFWTQWEHRLLMPEAVSDDVVPVGDKSMRRDQR